MRFDAARAFRSMFFVYGVLFRRVTYRVCRICVRTFMPAIAIDSDGVDKGKRDDGTTNVQ